MKLVILMSGGIDSPVASYRMTQVGNELHAVHFSQEPLTDDAAEKKALAVAKISGCVSFCTFIIGKELAEIANTCNERYYFVLQKRLMFRIAEKYAQSIHATGLVSGESLGQVGSQTLSNLHTITQSITMQIYRPLLGFNKTEIIEHARKIGTFEISQGPELCTLLGPKHPATTSRLEIIETEEKKIDLNSMITNVLKNPRIQKIELLVKSINT